MHNTSGMVPLKYRVIIQPNKVEEKTAGGLYLPTETKDKEKYNQEEGVLVVVGSLAFTDPEWKRKPKAGDKILFDKFAGKVFKGKDGEDYIIMNDDDLGAIIT